MLTMQSIMRALIVKAENEKMASVSSKLKRQTRQTQPGSAIRASCQVSRLRLLKMRPRHFIVFLELSMKKVQRGDDIYNGDKRKKVGRQDAVPYPQDAGQKPEKTAQQITIQNLTAIGKFTVFNIKRPPCMRCISII